MDGEVLREVGRGRLGRSLASCRRDQGRRGKTWWVVIVLWAASAAGVFAAARDEAATVRLPLDEYRRMLERAVLEPEAEVVPRLPVALESAELEIELGARTATVLQRLEFVLWLEQWQELPLPAADQLVDVQLGGLEGRVDLDRGVLRVRGEGRFRVVLRQAVDLAVRSQATRRQRTLRLQLPQMAEVRGAVRDVDPAGEDDTLELKGGGTVLRTIDRGVEFVAAPSSTLEVVLAGAGPMPDANVAEARFSAQLMERVEWSPTAVRLRAGVSVRTLQGELAELKVRLPSGFELSEVDERSLAGWDVVDGVAVLRFLEPLRDAATVELTLQAPRAQSLETPVLEVEGAVRQRTVAAVAVIGDGILDLVQRGSLREIDGSLRVQRGPGVSSPGYQMVDHEQPGEWRVVWPEQTDVLALRIDRLTADLLVGERGESVYAVALDVVHRGATTLRLELPPGFRLVRAERDGNRTRPGRSAAGAAAGSETLVLALDPRSSAHRFQVVGVLPTPPLERAAQAGRLLLPLPAADAPISQVAVRAQLPDDWRYQLARAERRAVRGGGFEQIELLAASPGFVEVRSSWSAMSDRPGALEVEVTERRQREEWF